MSSESVPASAPAPGIQLMPLPSSNGSATDRSLSPTHIAPLSFPHVPSNVNISSLEAVNLQPTTPATNGGYLAPPVPANGTTTPINPQASYTPSAEKQPDSKEAAAGASAPAPVVPTYTITEAEKEAVHRVYDPASNDFMAAMEAFNDAQISYYGDTLTPDKLRILNVKASRVAGDVEAEPNVTLTWRNVGYTKKGETEPRLAGLSGVLRPKQTVCILGGPDSGITSLLMVLSGRHQAGQVTGEILINGAVPDASRFRRVGFVPKDDIHLAALTVQETLEFSARMRLPPVIPDRVKRLRALNVMKLLGLRHAAHTIVGSETIRGISGGEKRRLSIGVELVAGQMSLLADLPTNGLDSASAFEVIATYKKLAQSSGRSLMCSLVQPSPELLDQFESVLLMSKGRCVYYGPRATVEQHFFGIGYRMPASDDKKSVPDYLEELSVQPERYYYGVDPITDEKGQVVVRQNAKVFIPEIKNAAPKKARLSISGEALSLDDVAHRDAPTAAGASAYVPRRSVTDAPAPVPALTVPSITGGVITVAEHKHATPSQQQPAAGSLVPVEHALDDQYGGRDPNAPKPQRELIVKGKRVRVSHYEAMQHLMLAYAQSEQFRVVASEVEMSFKLNTPADLNAYTYNTNFVYQMGVSMERQVKLVWRNKGASVGELIKAVVLALLVGSLFWQIGTDQKDMRTRFGLFFFVLMFQIMGSLEAIPGLMDQRLVYYSQTGNSVFRGPAFYISYTFSQVPVVVAANLIFFFILYPMSGMNGVVGGPEFWYLWFLTSILGLTGRAWCLFIGAIAPSQPIALGLTPVSMISFTMFCGFMVPRDAIPDGWIWLYYLSFFTWAFRGAAQNELVGKTFFCHPEEYLQISKFAEPICPIPDGVAALAQYSMDPKRYDDGSVDTNEKWVMLRNLIFFWIAFNAAACYALYKVNYFNNDASMVGKLDDAEDEEVLETDEAAAAAHANGDANGTVAVKVPAKTSPRSRSPKRAAANGAHVINIAPAVTEVVEPAPKRKYEMVVTPTTLSFNNLTYSIDIPGQKEPRELLKKTFGFAKPGMMVALMGPSGAGKSTLLDVLANKKNGGYITGSLLINGKPRDEKFQLISGYVEQTDSHEEFSTVREAIEFSANLRLPQEMSAEEKQDRVESVLDKLNLRYVQHRQIGSVEHGGVSPELRKKVTIAVELVMNPAILFLDEPTTGLDSMAAMAVMDAVRKLASTISVICTVHQPSAEIVERFDYMLLMQKGGEVAYCGPIHALSDYLGSVGLGKCPEGRNIADHALEVAGGGIKLNATKMEHDPAALFLSSPQCAAVKREVAALGHDVAAPRADKIPLGDALLKANTSVCANVIDNDTTSSLPNQLWELSRRFTVSKFRDNTTFRGRMGSAVVISFILSTLYYQLGHGQLDAANRVSLVFLSALFPCFSAGELIPKIVEARPVYFRERQAKMYTPLMYFMGRFIGGLPFILFEAIIYCVVMYFVADLTQADGGSHFWIFFAVYIMMRIAGFSFAELCASLVEKADAATGMQGLVLVLFMLFAGFLVPKAGIPTGWQWMYYASIFRYPISLLANNELRGLQFECPNNVGAIGPLPLYNASATTDSLTLTCTTPSIQYENTNCYGYLCPITSGDQMLSQFDMSGDSIGVFYAILAGMTVFYTGLSYIVLKKVQHIKR